MEEARRARGLDTQNVRVGMLCGGKNGASKRGWFGPIIKSGEVLGCLPGGEDVILPLSLCYATVAHAYLAVDLVDSG